MNTIIIIISLIAIGSWLLFLGYLTIDTLKKSNETIAKIEEVIKESKMLKDNSEKKGTDEHELK